MVPVRIDLARRTTWRSASRLHCRASSSRMRRRPTATPCGLVTTTSPWRRATRCTNDSHGTVADDLRPAASAAGISN